MIKLHNSQYRTSRDGENNKNMFAVWIQVGKKVLLQKHFELKR